MIEIEAGLWIDPRQVAAVKESPLEKGRCTVFLRGQSAVDGGFLIERDAQEVVDEIEAGEEDDE